MGHSHLRRGANPHQGLLAASITKADQWCSDPLSDGKVPCWGQGKVKRCLTSMLAERSSTLRKTVKAIQSFSFMNLDTISGSGKLKSGIFRAHTDALPTTLAVI